MSATTAPAVRRVLFVCVENANRSQMAEAFARMHGGGVVEAYSAGSRPADQVSHKAVASMREVGCDLSSHRPKTPGELPDVEFDVVVTMGCGDACPVVRARRRVDWIIPDPKALPPDEYRDVRDMIEARVKALLADL
jgi:protein-tyrosine-phosphatase